MNTAMPLQANTVDRSCVSHCGNLLVPVETCIKLYLIFQMSEDSKHCILKLQKRKIIIMRSKPFKKNEMKEEIPLFKCCS